MYGYYENEVEERISVLWNGMSKRRKCWHTMIRQVFGCFMIHVISILSLYKSTNSSTNSSILLVSTMILLVVLCEAAHALPLTRPAEMRRHFDSPSAPSTSSNRFGIVREGVDASLAFLPSTTSYWTDMDFRWLTPLSATWLHSATWNRSIPIRH